MKKRIRISAILASFTLVAVMSGCSSDTTKGAGGLANSTGASLASSAPTSEEVEQASKQRHVEVMASTIYNLARQMASDYYVKFGKEYDGIEKMEYYPDSDGNPANVDGYLKSVYPEIVDGTLTYTIKWENGKPVEVTCTDGEYTSTMP